MKIQIKCKQCNKNFSRYPSQTKNAQYCSRKCHSKSQIGRKMTSEQLERHRLNRLGEKNGRWKGDLVGKLCLHRWIKKHYGKANFCENRENKILSIVCSNESTKYEWANKKPYLYKRDIKTWMQLCAFCHRRYDLTLESIERSRMIGKRDSKWRKRNNKGQYM